MKDDNLSDYSGIEELLDYVETDEEGKTPNFLKLEVDGDYIDIDRFYIDYDDYYYFKIVYDDKILTFNINTGNYIIDYFDVDYIKITLNTKVEDFILSSGIISLISLIPLIITAGLITYQYKNLKYKK